MQFEGGDVVVQMVFILDDVSEKYVDMREVVGLGQSVTISH